MRRLSIAVVGLFLLLAACSDAEQAARDGVVDFDEIAVSDVAFVFDSSATSARVEVETTIRTICAVAFGETEDLGRLATDQDMDAAGHLDHDPVITGLQPETEYFYRLQGVGPDGTLYQSGLLRFATPSAEKDSGATNLALTATVIEVSSEFSADFGGVNAIDGNSSTEWSSNGDGDSAYIIIDLGRAVEVSGFRFVTREMSDGSSIATSYTVTVDDAVFGPFGAGLDPALVEVDFIGRVLRFDIETSTGGNTGAVEVEVYGR